MCNPSDHGGEFARYLDPNGWLYSLCEDGVVLGRSVCHPKWRCLPSMKQLEAWSYDSTGYDVEPDGEGPDGAPSWLRALKPAAAVVAHPGQDFAQLTVPPPGVHLVDHLHLAAAVALDAQEPRGERTERLAHGLCTRWQRLSVPSLCQRRLGALLVVMIRRETEAGLLPGRRPRLVCQCTIASTANRDTGG
jgi:hypothetical protein